MIGLETLTTTQLSAWVRQAKALTHQGQVAERIPQLALANPHLFAVHICCSSKKLIAKAIRIVFSPS